MAGRAAHDGRDHHHHAHPSFDTPEVAAATELEGEVLIDFVEEAAAVLTTLSAEAGLDVRRVLDLGSGPGVAACCLAKRFTAATVLAVDGSEAMLERATARAERLGLGGRVEARRSDFADLATLGRAQLIWASMSLHHVGDEQATLEQVRELLPAGGLVALVERNGPTRVLPDVADLGRPGIWERFDVAWEGWFTEMRSDLANATESASYPAMLEAAGFDVVADRVLAVNLDPPLDGPARQVALRMVNQTRRQLDGHADPDDLAALDVLLDEAGPVGVMHRSDVLVRATRRLYVGRR